MIPIIMFGIVFIFLTLNILGLVSLASVVHFLIGLFPWILAAVLGIELVVSIVFIVRRIQDGDETGKPIIASILCMSSSAMYLYVQYRTTHVWYYIISLLVLGTIWLEGAVHTWLRILEGEDGGKGLRKEIVLAAVFLVLVILTEF